MRMSATELGGDALDDTAEIKQARLFRHASVKDDLQQKVAEFLTQIFARTAFDRVGYFVGFFDCERAVPREGFRDPPRAAVNRITERRHDVDKATNVARGMHGRGQQPANGMKGLLDGRKERREGAPELWLPPDFDS